MGNFIWVIPIIILVFVIIIIAILTSKGSEDNNDNNIHIKHHYERRERHIIDYDKIEQEQFGQIGEKYVANMLSNISSKHKAYVFNDFTFMDDNGYSTNIDHILVCQGGVFIIETKSNIGFIYGNDEDDEWYAEKEEWQDDKTFKNPVKQNQGHINHLKRMFKNTPPKMISMIVFPAADSLRRVDSNCVYDVQSAEDFILKKIIERKYSNQFVDRIGGQLQDIIDQYGISIDGHKRNLNDMFN